MTEAEIVARNVAKVREFIDCWEALDCDHAMRCLSDDIVYINHPRRHLGRALGGRGQH